MITKRPRAAYPALVIVILLACAVAGCTFPGTAKKATPLTADELAYFNGNEFFNGESINIRNQFLSSLYDTPKKINLFELFYCGIDPAASPTEAEVKAIMAQEGWTQEPPCGCSKVSRTDVDAVLMKYTGLSLADTDKIGLESFTYLKDYDAYYYYHGDTNYRNIVAFSRGEREGDLIRLFYDDEFIGDGGKVLTLREKDNQYLIVSNQRKG